MNSAALKTLLICPDSDRSRQLQAVLADCGLDPVVCSRLADAKTHLLHSRRFDLVFCEDTLPDASLPDVLETLKSAAREIPVVVCSPYGDFPEYLQAMECGAFDFIVPPYPATAVQCIISAIQGTPRSLPASA